MEDYVAGDRRFAGAEGSTLAGESQYLNYIFSMSARDTARFGYLYLRMGLWRDRQIVPARWVTRSTTSYSNSLNRPNIPAIGNGFLWWVTDWGYEALGQDGHVIVVISTKDLVIVHRVHYDPPREDAVAYRDVDAMVRMVIAAAPARDAASK